ncbi:MAG: CDP-alcohol phosphatidyltransferase family protein [Pseudomonadota bacterium]
MTNGVENRRPIKARSSAFANVLARKLADIGCTPDQISMASVGFAALAGAAFLLAPIVGPPLYLVAAISCPLRLLANLLDGMVAVEHGKASPVGPLFNEVPDRVADVLILASMGIGAGWVVDGGFVAALAPLLGWCAAVLALMTAYIRELGRALGNSADFCGPFAKQQRMWVVSGAAFLAAVLGGLAPIILFSALLLLTLGTAFTVLRRLQRLAAALRAQPSGTERRTS